MTNMRRIVLPQLFLAVGFFCTSSFAQHTTTIYACVKEDNGKIVIVSPSDRCANNYYKISWNTPGPARAGPGIDSRLVPRAGYFS